MLLSGFFVEIPISFFVENIRHHNPVMTLRLIRLLVWQVADAFIAELIELYGYEH